MSRLDLRQLLEELAAGQIDVSTAEAALTSRLDLDDYNNEVSEGLHITSMGGTWMSVVYGFGGMKIREGMLSFDPQIPAQWKGLAFTILYRGNTLKVSIDKGKVIIENLEGSGLDLYLAGTLTHLAAAGTGVADL